MKVVGVTGSSGSGKTTVARILQEDYGAYIIDADVVAKKLSENGSIYLNEIVNYFGNDILDNNGNLARKKLAELIFNDNVKRNKLNEISFKFIVDEIKQDIQLLRQEKLIVIDAPLLFESDLDQLCDIIIGIIADEDIKIKRICKRDNISKEDAQKRIKVQKDNDFIIKYSDFVIENNIDIINLKDKIKLIPIK